MMIIEKSVNQLIDMCSTDYREMCVGEQINPNLNSIFEQYNFLFFTNIQIQLVFSFHFVQLFLRNIFNVQRHSF